MWVRQKPFSVWVIAGGLVYMGLALLSLGLPFAIAGGIMAGGGFLLILFVFVAVFLIAAVFSLRQQRWAYIIAAASSIVLLLLFGTFILDSGQNPADSGFWLSMSGVPATVLVVLFSILSFRNAKTGLTQKRYLATAKSTGGLLTFAVIGFIIGAIIAGAIGAGVILRNLSAGSADIEIVPGAPSAAMAFSPQTFHASVGDTVLWINKDTTSHTVTSNGTGPLNSPLMSTGGTYSYRFTVAGTYYYYCNPHPQMWGVLIVS
ncbi:MAG: cupredoxin domain-containing protein [Thermoplasmata archaeon]